MYEMSCNVEGRPAVKLSDNYAKNARPAVGNRTLPAHVRYGWNHAPLIA